MGSRLMRTVRGICLAGALVWAACAGGGCMCIPELAALGPAAWLASSHRAEVAQFVQGKIQDGHGRWRTAGLHGPTYLDYYVSLSETEDGTYSTSSISGLSSSVIMFGLKWGNAGEAVVQEGYGEIMCKRILEKGQAWEKEWETCPPGKLRRLGTSIFIAYSVVMELRALEYLHNHVDILIEEFPDLLDCSPPEFVKGRKPPDLETLIRRARESPDNVIISGTTPGGGYWPKLDQYLLASGDELFKAAHEGMQRYDER